MVDAPKAKSWADVQAHIERTASMLRAFDEAMVKLQREGHVAYYASTEGEEIAMVAAASALSEGDWLFPSTRDHGAALAKGTSLTHLAHHFFGTSVDVAKGRQKPNLFADNGYEPIKDFKPVGLVTSVPMVLVANKSVPARNLTEFLDYARAHSGKPCRVVRSAFSDAWAAPGAPEPLDMPYQQALTGQLLAAVEEHHIGPLMYEAAGQSVAWLRAIEPVDQVMQRLVSQTRVALQALKPYL